MSINTGQEIMLVDISIQEGEISNTQLALNNDLARINDELERYTCKARKEEYVLAIASGILAGIVDAFYVKDAPLFDDADAGAEFDINRWVNRIIGRSAKVEDNVNPDPGDGQLLDAIKNFAGYIRDARENVPEGKGVKIYADDRQLKALAQDPTPTGLVAAIVGQLSKAGIFAKQDGERNLLADCANRQDVLKLVIPAAITGFLNWIVGVSESAGADQDNQEVPEAIRKLAAFVANAPIIIELAANADIRFENLLNDRGVSKPTAPVGMDVPGEFLSMLYEIAALPPLNNTGLREYLDALYAKDKIDVFEELEFVEENGAQMMEGFGKQDVPVLLNEVLMRTGYFLLQLARAVRDVDSPEHIDWRSIIPVENRTVDRMMTVSTMTLMLADTADAAINASLESAGDAIVYSQRFAARFNYVAAGRAAIAVVREVSDDARELQLLHEKRLLTEAKTAFTIEQLEAYKAELQGRLDAYLQEDLEAFLLGFNLMDPGLQQGDSNLVIEGNVVIQKALGRESQFTNQDEFDSLMESDDDFIF